VYFDFWIRRMMRRFSEKRHYNYMLITKDNCIEAWIKDNKAEKIDE
jgi:hypothetical protein